MGVTKILVLAALCAVPALAGSAGEGEYAARLEARAEAALERMLGPGRAALIVEIRGERVTKRETSQISGAGGREAPPEPALIELPGYTKNSSPRPARSSSGGATLIHAAADETLREGSFAVSGVRAWLVLDKSLKEGPVAEAVRVTGGILALDPARGDELTVVRTAFLPSWRAAFSRPRDARNLALLALAAAALVAAAALLGGAAMKSALTLSDALTRARQASPGPSTRPALPLEPARRIIPLPPLDKGGRG